MGQQVPAGAATSTWSEAASKRWLSDFGVPFAPESEVATVEQAVAAAEQLGFPVALKLSGARIAHKTERGLVRLGLADAAAVRTAGDGLLAQATPADGEVSLLVAPMVGGARELIAGAARDPQFGPTVLVGVGGILAEVTADVSIRLAPLSHLDALEMVGDLRAQALLGAFRGEPAVDRAALAGVLVALSDAITASEDVISIDVNPLIVHDGRPVAVDALVEVDTSQGVDR